MVESACTYLYRGDSQHSYDFADLYYLFWTERISGLYNLAAYANFWVVGIGTLALNYAAYEAEVFRAGFLSVDRGQTEAAFSLGLNASAKFLRIVFPQAIPLMIPPFVNDLIYMLKDSAIISVIGGAEITS